MGAGTYAEVVSCEIHTAHKRKHSRICHVLVVYTRVHIFKINENGESFVVINYLFIIVEIVG